MSDPVPLATVASTLRWLSREMERDGSGLAHVPAQVAALLTRPVGGGCKSCGGPVELVPVGRPRLHCEACRRPRRQTRPKVARWQGWKTIPDLADGELRTVLVRTSRYVFELTRTADGSTSTTFTPIAETTPDQGAGATENPQGGSP